MTPLYPPPPDKQSSYIGAYGTLDIWRVERGNLGWLFAFTFGSAVDYFALTEANHIYYDFTVCGEPITDDLINFCKAYRNLVE